MIKSYAHKIDANTKKCRYIENDLYPEWKRVAKKLVNKHMRYYYEHSVLLTNLDDFIYKDVETSLTERYKKCINRQVVGMLKSKISNAKNKFIDVVRRSTLPEKTKKSLYTVCDSNLFFLKEDKRDRKNKISSEDIKLGRKIYKMFFGKIPSCKNINMILQSMVVEIQDPLNTNNDFKYMLRLSKGNKNKRGEFLYLPIVKNNYSDKFEGKLSTSCSLNFKEGKLKEVVFSKEFEEKETELNDMTISFDIGLNILIAMDNGDCYGKYYMRKIKNFDKQLIEVQNKLKAKYGKYVKLNKYPEYYKLVKKIRDFSKNEINRLINKIYCKYRPKNIIIEDLNFKGSSLSKKMNRLLHKFGLGLIKAKLMQLSIEYKVNIITTDAAYSSQVCSKCGYIDSENRKTQSKFICKCCGHRINADVNGSRVVKYFGERFADKTFYGNKGRNSKRTLLVADFISNEKVWRDNSRFIQVMMGNSYFKDYLTLLREKYKLLSIKG